MPLGLRDEDVQHAASDTPAWRTPSASGLRSAGREIVDELQSACPGRRPWPTSVVYLPLMTTSGTPSTVITLGELLGALQVGIDRE